MDWILIVIILLCLASLVLNIIQVSRNNSENFANMDKSVKLSDSPEKPLETPETDQEVENFADVKNGSYLNFFDSEVPFVPAESWVNLKQCYLNH